MCVLGTNGCVVIMSKDGLCPFWNHKDFPRTVWACSPFPDTKTCQRCKSWTRPSGGCRAERDARVMGRKHWQIEVLSETLPFMSSPILCFVCEWKIFLDLNKKEVFHLCFTNTAHWINSEKTQPWRAIRWKFYIEWMTSTALKLRSKTCFFAMLIQGHHKYPLMRWSSSLHVPKKASPRCLSAPHPCISFNVVRNEEHWWTLMFKECPSVAVGWRKCYFKYERSWREATQIFWRARYSFSNYAKR